MIPENKWYDVRPVKSDDITHIAQELFEFYLLDEIASNFRKMLLVDRYRDGNIDLLYEKIFIDDPITYQTEVFSLLLLSNKVKFGNAVDMADIFYSQIYFLLQKYDGKKKSEDKKKEIETFINLFCYI